MPSPTSTDELPVEDPRAARTQGARIALEERALQQPFPNLPTTPRVSTAFINMARFAFLSTLLSGAAAMVSATTDVSKLPVFFFHGVMSNYTAGNNFVANLTAEGRTVVSLSFCDGTCSIESLLTQVPEAIKAVREHVANNSVFNDGYIFIGHSQGGPISRATIEEMDDHKVVRYISMAGLQNGQFIGHNKVNMSIANGAAFLTRIVPETVFNYSTYTPEEYYGKLQKDFTLFSIENPDTQYQYAQFNNQRWPQFGSWSTTNKFLPVYNNVNPCLPGDDQCIYDQHRRKANFLKLQEAHFFASPADNVIMPWQSCIFGRYSEVDTIDEIESQYMNLTIVDMPDTLEYTSDTFGLRTLNERGGLFLHTVEDVSHSCWRGDEGDCKFWPTYDKYLYPVLV